MKGELLCKEALEIIFAQPFLKARPQFLKNPCSGYCLELDCYNQNLQIALEYQGIQHFQFTPFFHKTKHDFLQQQKRDQLKRELCLKNNVILLEVPFSIKHDQLFVHLVTQLKQVLENVYLN